MLPGPEIEGRKTNIYLFEADQLAASHLLPGFLPSMNAAFSARHPPWIPAGHIRMESTDQLLRELGSQAFTYGFVFADDAKEIKDVVATASGKPFRLRPPIEQDPKHMIFYYDEEHASPPNTETWELKLMSVDPRLQKNGLAGLMLGQVETEIRRRFEEKKLQDAKIPSGGEAPGMQVAQRKLRMILQTLYEMNGEFYIKRGWKLINTRKSEKGFLGSEAGFHVGFLEKIIDF